jgi:uncharacterized DUF497 family protein
MLPVENSTVCHETQQICNITRFDYDEWRFITVGLLHGRVVVLSHTQRGQAIRMISMREGTKREEIRFFKNLRS